MIPAISLDRRALVAAIVLSGALAACGSQASPGSSSTASTATPSASAAASATPAVLAQTVGSNGMILVAGSNSMTVYTFSRDTAGVSNCTGACATTWPPLTVPSGQTPSGGTGVTGTLATITRTDGSLQVTYKGLPLYLFARDTKPGDTNGHYTNWNLVTP
jgi:predicted lipoprotein with Yx(FWY)xxD motif